MKNEIERKKMDRYLTLTKNALEKVKITAPEPSHLHQIAEDFLNMATSYYRDALYFYQQDDYVNAFAAVNYAHGWLDAGARLGLFEVGQDHSLFTLTE